MRENEKKKDIVEILEEFRQKTLTFNKELERVNLPYIKMANKHLGDVVEQTIKDIKEYIKLVDANKVLKKPEVRQ